MPFHLHPQGLKLGHGACQNTIRHCCRCRGCNFQRSVSSRRVSTKPHTSKKRFARCYYSAIRTSNTSLSMGGVRMVRSTSSKNMNHGSPVGVVGRTRDNRTRSIADFAFRAATSSVGCAAMIFCVLTHYGRWRLSSCASRRWMCWSEHADCNTTAMVGAFTIAPW